MNKLRIQNTKFWVSVIGIILMLGPVFAQKKKKSEIDENYENHIKWHKIVNN